MNVALEIWEEVYMYGETVIRFFGIALIINFCNVKFSPTKVMSCIKAAAHITRSVEHIF